MFIINIIPIYVVVMVVAGRYSSRLYIAYSTFYALGSIMAMQASAQKALRLVCSIRTVGMLQFSARVVRLVTSRRRRVRPQMIFFFQHPSFQCGTCRDAAVVGRRCPCASALTYSRNTRDFLPSVTNKAAFIVP